MTFFAGQGDARRSMRLLWRVPDDGRRDGAGRRGPGRRPELSVDAIVAAAVELADAEGMAAVSMRAVGERLGRTAMALYTYVPSKGELVDLMYDRALGELAAAGAGEPERGWRPALAAWAREALEFHLRHPWLLQVSQARPVLGPGEFAAMESLVRVLRATGLPARVLRGTAGALFQLVRGTAQVAAEARRAPAETGVPEADWWYGRAALLEEVAPDFADRFPGMLWLQREGAAPEEGAAEHEAAEQEAGDCETYLERQARVSFAAGLAVFLDGVEAAVHAHESNQT